MLLVHACKLLNATGEDTFLTPIEYRMADRSLGTNHDFRQQAMSVAFLSWFRTGFTLDRAPTPLVVVMSSEVEFRDDAKTYRL